MLRKILRQAPSSSPAISTPDLGRDEPMEEERVPHTALRCFYPMHLGDVLNDRYLVTAKLGYGGRSTVWLAKDLHRWRWQKNRYVAIKVAVTGDVEGEPFDYTELETFRSITGSNPEHPGHQYVLTLWDSFSITSPAGQHVCLVFEPLREPVRVVKQCFTDGKLPVGMVITIIPLLLEALDYLHAECHIIHCDISENSILFRFSRGNGTETLREHSNLERTDPFPVKRLLDRTIYLSHNSFGPLVGNIGACVLTDFGTSVCGDGAWNHNIQPTGMTAPEVLLRAKWSYSADIWNFGALLCGLMEGKPLFDDAERERWMDFSEAASFARMVAFLGPPPDDLLDRAERLEEFYDEQRVFKYPQLIPKDCSLEAFLTDVHRPCAADAGLATGRKGNGERAAQRSMGAADPAETAGLGTTRLLVVVERESER